jgi:tetratricopeptide (TPR) repeat protein
MDRIFRVLAMKLTMVLLSLTLLAGCQSTADHHRLHRPAQTLLLDTHFAKPQQQIESPEQIFALPAEVVQDLRVAVLAYTDPQERSLALLKFIFNEGGDVLEYVNSATLVASETLTRRQANCLSLTILAYSLADALGFATQFQDVDVPEYWITRSGNSFLNGHVNLIVNPDTNLKGLGQIVYRQSNFLIDFDRVPSRSKLKTTEVGRPAIISMFYNNKAADAMFIKDYDAAYQYLKAAIAFGPELSANWNNLAVLYRHKQLYAAAEQVYLHSLMLEPDHSNTMANLAMLYQVTGRLQQATELEKKIAQKRLTNPFYFVMLGNEAFAMNDAETALAHFRHSLKLQPNTPEALFGMAQSYLLKGDLAKASSYLQSAKKSAEPGPERRRYQSKLNLLHAIAKQA